MIDPAEYDKSGITVSARAVFVISPNWKLKAYIFYQATTGRNFDENLSLVAITALGSEV